MPRLLAAIAALLIVSLTLLASPLRAQGKLEIVEKFTKGNAELSVAHFTDPSVEKSKSKVGLIGIASPSRNSFAFNKGEWTKLIELCQKAIAIKSAGWTQVGSMTETGTEDVSQLTLSAGPGVSFVISSPKAGTVSYIIQKADLPRLQKGLLQVRDYLAK